MPKATLSNGALVPIPNCYIIVPIGNQQVHRITVNNLPEVSDSKGASYNDQTVQGRSTPIKTFSSGENRTIAINLHLYVTSHEDIQVNLQILRTLQSALYTRSAAGGAPFVPPAICRIRCGKILSDNELCVILTNCQVNHPTDVVWDEATLLPYQMDVSTTWQVVYKNTDLPGQSKILRMGG